MGNPEFAHVHQEVVPPSRFSEEIPADLEAIIMKCLAKSRSDRYQDAGELETALLACHDAHVWTVDGHQPRHEDFETSWAERADRVERVCGEQPELSGATRDQIEEEANKALVCSLREAALERVRAGVTTVEEVVRVAGIDAARSAQS